ncbi:MAG: IS200/IS605 family transposase [Nitrosopumilus sp.]|nr:IS200/IS605 family transposase [Nitrosopumilus sp.]MDH5727395.1 IS200/IS605 family transposase [Gammaproteobacteria bacterium]
MTITSDIRTGRHCVFNMHVHLVFVTKYRKNIFTSTILADMKNLFGDVCESFEAELISFDGEGDHVHLLVHYPPKVAVSKLVNSLKGVSSRKLRTIHPSLKKKYYKGVLWSPSYFSGSCGGAPLSTIKAYIAAQHTPS